MISMIKIIVNGCDIKDSSKASMKRSMSLGADLLGTEKVG